MGVYAAIKVIDNFNLAIGTVKKIVKKK